MLLHVSRYLLLAVGWLLAEVPLFPFSRLALVCAQKRTSVQRKGGSTELTQYPFPCILLMEAGYKASPHLQTRRRGSFSWWEEQRHCKEHGFGEAINLPQLKMMALDWNLGGVESGPELPQLHTPGAVHTPRYPGSMVLVWDPHMCSFQAKLPRYSANIRLMPPL